MASPITLALRIDWSEMDLFGHVNNVSFMKYVQSGRVHFWENIGLTTLYETTKRGPMLAATSCNFIKPLHYPGQISIETRVEFIKTTSFGLHHQILNEENQVAAEAHDVLVMFDFNTNQKIEIPPELRKTLEALS